jgi:hypothetical protein
MDLLHLKRSGEMDLLSPEEEIHFSESFQMQEISGAEKDKKF